MSSEGSDVVLVVVWQAVPAALVLGIVSAEQALAFGSRLACAQ